DGSGSSDTDGDVETWSWDFGDGSEVATSSSASASHSFAAAGDYDVKLTVTDDDGATDTVTKSITVASEPINTPPVADFSQTATDLSVDFDGSASTDAEGPIASWAWDLGDGTTKTGRTVSHNYAASGDYQV